MVEAEEAVHPLKDMKLNKKSTEDKINTFKHDFKESFSACCNNYFTGMQACADAQHRRKTECSCVKQIFDATKLLSVAESASEFVASDKTVKDKCMSDVVGSGHVASQFASSRKKCVFMLDDADGTYFCKNTIKILLSIHKHEHNSIASKYLTAKDVTTCAKKNMVKCRRSA